MPNKNAWSETDTDILRSNWGKCSAGIISKNFLGGRFSRNACLGKAYRIGLPRLTTAPKIQAPKPERKPVVTVQPDVAAPEPIGPINDFSGCKWIAGDPRPDFQTCGHKLKEGSSWCEFHAVRAVVPQTGKSRVDPDVRRKSGIDRAFG